MLNKKVAALTLAAVISNFSAATTNVLAHEITQNVKTIATAKSDNNTRNLKLNNQLQVMPSHKKMNHKKVIQLKLAEPNRAKPKKIEHSHLHKTEIHLQRQETT